LFVDFHHQHCRAGAVLLKEGVWMDRKQIILWGAWYGSKNVGDQALLLSITDMLGDVIDDIEFIVITADPSHVLEYTKRDSIHRFRALHARKKFLEVVKAFRSADVFIFGGGVPFYDDAVHSMAITILVTLARIFRVPCALWAVSSQKIGSVWTKLVLQYLLSWVSVMTCRDRHTVELLGDCGVEVSKLQIVADPAFTLHSNDRDNAAIFLRRAGWKPEQPRPLVALTPRLLRSADGEAHTHYTPKTDTDSRKEIDTFAALLDWLWENNYQPIFIPMHAVSPDDDRIAAHQIMRKSKFGGNTLIVNEVIHPRDAENVYRRCHAAFVARVHGMVTAFLGRCPVMMYAFDLKHAGIMEQVGLFEYVFRPERNSSEDAVRMMSRLLEARVDLIAGMEERHEYLVKQAQVPRDAVLGLLKRK
jgi:polysaccharide pyruvyl transferase WcaK-like protein